MITAGHSAAIVVVFCVYIRRKMDPATTELACQSCTFVNEHGSKICDACGRSLGLPMINLNASGILCPQCTYGNPVGTKNCSVCQSTLTVNSITVPTPTPTVNVMSTSTIIVPIPTPTMDMDDGQSCRICFANMNEEFTMPVCNHSFCKTCARQHFTIKIVECGINSVCCPIDGCVSFGEMSNKPAFFQELLAALYNVVDVAERKIFADKIAILDIIDKPGFMRCSLCNSGFINRSRTKKINCPSCYQSFCLRCNKKWITGHTSVKCQPKGNASDSNKSDDDVRTHCNAECPKCKYKYFLEQGGCMHITCSQCSYEYCVFCRNKFTGKGKLCDFPKCSKGQALHGHHPRNCMYYVRDMDHTKLENLLKNKGVRYSEVQINKATLCPVKVNKMGTNGIWVDSECQEPASKAYNNLCLTHYKWHLGELMKKHNIDPVDVMDNQECFCELKRNNVPVDNHADYCKPIEDANTAVLRALVQKHIPYQKIL